MVQENVRTPFRVLLFYATQMLQQEVDASNDILRDAYFILPLQSTAAAGPGNEFNALKPQPFFVKKTDSTPRPTR